MPADADLLCEYFLSSQLSSNNNSSSSSANKLFNAVQSHHQQLKGVATTGSNGASASFKFETIDFAKYTKNAMSESLKLKYELLSTCSSISNSSSLKSAQHVCQHNGGVNGTNKPLTNGIIKSQQQQTVLTSTTIPKPLSNGGVVADAEHNSSRPTQTLDLTWSRIRTRGIGLLNLGNNCYLNATLQCLAYTAPLSQWLVTRPHSPNCRFRLVKGFCSLCEVERIIFDIFNSAGAAGAYSYAKPNNLCFNIKKISNLFGVGTQEDASEFFTTLLENMAKAIKFSTPQQQLPNGTRHHKRSHTILDDIFAFQFRSRITCSSCGRLSDTIEDTNIWPLEVKYVQDIRKGMLHFLKEEILDGENAYKCEKCGRKTRATKKYSIRSAPNILVIHLKRFDSSHHGGGGGKLTHYVSYPETFQLPDLIPSDASSSPAQYQLYGVLVHLGYTSHSGHYYAYVRGPPHGQQWYKCDDQSVSAVSAQDAMAQNAYILFYARALTDATATVTKVSTAQSQPQPRPIVVNGTNGIITKTIVTNTTLMQPRQLVVNKALNIPSSTKQLNSATSIVNKSLATNESIASSYLNSILVAKRPQNSTSHVIAPRIIKMDDSGPSPAKIPRLEYGPQLPPNLNGTAIITTQSPTSESSKQNGHHSPSSPRNTINISTTTTINTTTIIINNNSSSSLKTTSAKRKSNNDSDSEIHSSKQQKSSETTLANSPSPSPLPLPKKLSKKELREKRLKKLMKKLRQGHIRPDEVTDKQMKYAKSKKERKHLRKLLRKKKEAFS